MDLRLPREKGNIPFRARSFVAHQPPGTGNVDPEKRSSSGTGVETEVANAQNIWHNKQAQPPHTQSSNWLRFVVSP
jgi:hypothetical protein